MLTVQSSPALARRDHQAARRVEPRLERDALLEGGGQHQRLHGRARLPTGTAAAGGVVELVGVEVAPTHHRPHVAVVDGDERSGRVALELGGGGVVGAVERGRDGVPRRLLGRVVEGRVDAEAAAVDLVVGEAVVVAQHLADVLDEVGGAVLRSADLAQTVALGARAGRCRPSTHGSAFGGVVGGLVDHPFVEHGVEHRLAAEGGHVGVATGVGGLGGTDQAGQVGGFGEVELGDVLAEVGPGGGAHPVGAPPEVDEVEVALEDLLLLELLLELHRQHRLLDLAGDGALGGEVDELHVLLGDRGAALLDGVALDVAPRGAGDAGGVDAPVVEEVAVLGGQDRGDEHLGHLLERDVDAVLLGVEHGGGVVLAAALGLGDLGGADEAGELGDAGRRQLDLGQHEAGAGHRRDEQEPEGEEPAPPAPEEAAPLRRLPRLRAGPLGGRTAAGALLRRRLPRAAGFRGAAAFFGAADLVAADFFGAAFLALPSWPSTSSGLPSSALPSSGAAFLGAPRCEVCRAGVRLGPGRSGGDAMGRGRRARREGRRAEP